jgi:hypothetical protein
MGQTRDRPSKLVVRQASSTRPFGHSASPEITSHGSGRSFQTWVSGSRPPPLRRCQAVTSAAINRMTLPRQIRSSTSPMPRAETREIHDSLALFQAPAVTFQVQESLPRRTIIVVRSMALRS